MRFRHSALLLIHYRAKATPKITRACCNSLLPAFIAPFEDDGAGDVATAELAIESCEGVLVTEPPDPKELKELEDTELNML